MRNRTKRRGDTITEALETARLYPKLFTVRPIATLLKKLEECDRRIRDATRMELHTRLSRKVAYRTQRLKDDLRNDHLRILARLGRKVMGSAPGAERAFHAPGTRARGDVVVAASRAMLKVIGRRQRLFKELVEPDFFPKMKARTDELDREWRARDRGRKGWSRALDDVEAATSEGRQTIDLLTTFIIAHFRDEVTLIRCWRNAVRVRRRMGRPKAKSRRAPHSREVRVA